MDTKEILTKQGFKPFTQCDWYAYAGADGDPIIRKGTYCDFIFCSEIGNESCNKVEALFKYCVNEEFTQSCFTIEHPELINWDVFVRKIDEIVDNAKAYTHMGLQKVERSVKAVLRAYGYEVTL